MKKIIPRETIQQAGIDLYTLFWSWLVGFCSPWIDTAWNGLYFVLYNKRYHITGHLVDFIFRFPHEWDDDKIDVNDEKLDESKRRIATKETYLEKYSKRNSFDVS